MCPYFRSRLETKVYIKRHIVLTGLSDINHERLKIRPPTASVWLYLQYQRRLFFFILILYFVHVVVVLSRFRFHAIEKKKSRSLTYAYKERTKFNIFIHFYNFYEDNLKIPTVHSDGNIEYNDFNLHRNDIVKI